MIALPSKSDLINSSTTNGQFINAIGQWYDYTAALPTSQGTSVDGGSSSESTSTIQIRRDTAANWQTNNPVLKAGEIGLITGTIKSKFGDGTTSWNSLSYATGDSSGSSTSTGFSSAYDLRSSGHTAEKNYHIATSATSSTIEIARLRPTGINDSGSILLEIINEGYCPSYGAIASTTKVVLYRTGTSYKLFPLGYVSGGVNAGIKYAWEAVSGATSGSSSYDFMYPDISTASGTRMTLDTNYTSDYISIRVANIPDASSSNPVIVRSHIKIAGSSHKIWFNKNGSFTEPIVAAIGDSLVASYPVGSTGSWPSIRGYLQYGVSGETSAQILSRVPSILSGNSLTHAIIDGGGNDAINHVLDSSNAAATLDNIVSAVGLIKNAGVIPVVFIACPYNANMVYANRANWGTSSEFYAMTLTQHQQIESDFKDFMMSLKKWCIDNSVAYIDGYDFMLDRFGRYKTEWAYDGIHLNLTGYLNLAEIMDFTEGY